MASLIAIGNECCLVETLKVKDTYHAQHTDFIVLSHLYVTYNVSFTSPKRILDAAAIAIASFFILNSNLYTTCDTFKQSY